jgi:hypothetical protein
VRERGRARHRDPFNPNADPFDPDLAEFPTRTVSIDRVIDLLAPTHAPDRVACYRERMLVGDRFPPVSVLAIAGRYIVADGHKRLTAYKMLGRRDITIEMWTVRRFLKDQWNQAVANSRKNRLILAHSVTDPRESLRLIRSTALHWKRVATALIGRCHFGQR